jgi:hypothetical protein
MKSKTNKKVMSNKAEQAPKVNIQPVPNVAPNIAPNVPNVMTNAQQQQFYNYQQQAPMQAPQIASNNLFTNAQRQQQQAQQVPIPVQIPQMQMQAPIQQLNRNQLGAYGRTRVPN